MSDPNVSLQTVSYLIAALSFAVTCAYYIINLNNNKKNQELALKAQQQSLETRQAQLMMGVAQSYWSKDFVEASHISINTELKTMEDVNKLIKNREEFVAWNMFVGYFEAIGVLVRNNLIDVHLVSQLMSADVVSFWERVGDGVKDARRVLGYPRMMVETEYLYDRVVEHGRLHPELGIVSKMAYPSYSTAD